MSPISEDHLASIEASLTEQIPYLRRYAAVLCRDRDRADDLVQECLLRAIDNIEQFQLGTNLRAWLFTILRNAHLNHCRRDQRYQFSSLDDSENGWETPTPCSQTDVVALKELERCLMLIPEAQREALLLIVVEGMTYEEAASVMSVPVGTIRSRISRARRALMFLYDSQERPPAENCGAPSQEPRRRRASARRTETPELELISSLALS